MPFASRTLELTAGFIIPQSETREYNRIGLNLWNFKQK